MNNVPQPVQSILRLDNVSRVYKSGSGELTVSHNGRTVTYRSMDDLFKARDRIAAAIASQAGSRRGVTYRYTFTTGRGE